jgi:hypothetical protein
MSCVYKKYNTSITEGVPVCLPNVPLRWENGAIIPPGIASKTIFTKLDETGLLQDYEIQDARDGKLFLVLYGLVKYNDIFGVERETSMCQLFVPDFGWVMHGPNGLNRRT